MQPLRRVLLLHAFRIFDLAAMFVALLVTCLLVRGPGTWPESLAAALREPITILRAAFFAVSLLSWYVVFDRFRLYDSHRVSGLRAELRNVILACMVATLLTLAWSALFRVEESGVAFAVIFLTLSVSVLSASRATLRLMLRHVRRRGRNLRHAVIVGTNAHARQFENYLKGHRELGYVVEGFVDHIPEAEADADEQRRSIVCSYEEFPAYLREHIVDEVFVFAPIKSLYDYLSKIVAACEEQGIIIRLRSDIFPLSIGRLRVEAPMEGELPLLTVYTGRQHGWQVPAKRMLDTLVASTALVFLAPLMIIAALVIKATSRGPILFSQDRLGINKRRFRLYKFRTMVADAEERLKEVEHCNEIDGPVFKIKDDPRITRVGHLLRRTSIDELPQLFNVLLGDMSLVGPRPLPVRDYDSFDEDWTRRRFSVRPGITCLWQISGRANLSFERWMQLDMEYIDEWSLWLDLKILVKTVPAVVKTEGAY